MATNCEKDVNLESEKGDNPPDFNMEDYLLNDEVIHSPQISPLPSFAHVAPMVETTRANNTSIFEMAPMNKLDAPTLATLIVVIFTSIVEHVHNNCNFGSPSHGQIKEDLEGRGHVGVHLGKANRPSLKERNMEDLFGDNENDIANEVRTALATKVRGKKHRKPNEPIEKKKKLT